MPVLAAYIFMYFRTT